MTDIVYDFADIASRLANPNQIFPKEELVREDTPVVKPTYVSIRVGGGGNGGITDPTHAHTYNPALSPEAEVIRQVYNRYRSSKDLEEVFLLGRKTNKVYYSGNTGTLWWSDIQDTTEWAVGQSTFDMGEG